MLVALAGNVFFLLILITIPLFFIFRWLFKRFNVEKRRNLYAILATLGTLPVLYLLFVAYVFISVTSPDFEKIPFDQQRWQTDRAERYRMADDIIDSKLLIGKTKEEVIQTLGPTFTNYNDNHTAYYLGVVPSFSPDPYILNVHFENDKVSRVELTQ